MRLSKNKPWWYCPTNLKDEFHKSFIQVGKEPAKQAGEPGFTKASEVIENKLPKAEIAEVERNEKLDFEILLMEEIGVMQDSLEKIHKALEVRTKQ